jgi:predicted AlkP superfamily phosphohydrolase/phosphomutase
MEQRKVIVIGFDSATFDLIIPWAKEGSLPVFKKLMSEGAWSILRTVMPPMTAPAWSSFFTGRNPGRHGIFDFVRLNGYDIVPVSFLDIEGLPVWDILSEAGKKVIVYNVPLTYPVRPVNGIMVSGFTTPPFKRDFTYPLDIADEIDKVAGGYRIYAKELTAGRDAYLDSINEVTEKQFKVLRHFIKNKPWDFLFYIFQHGDHVQHHFWRYMQGSKNRYTDTIKDFYKKVDGYLAEILQAMDEDTTLMVVSDHGAGPLSRYMHTNNWLLDWGMIGLKKDIRTLFKKACFKLNISPALPGKTRYFFTFKNIDWEKTKAFCFTNHCEIFVNLKGRQPHGAVSPGAEYDSVCNELIERLYKARDPYTNERIVEKAYKRDEVYKGANIDKMPDVVFETFSWKYLARGGNKFYSSRLTEKAADMSGTHRPEGIAIFYGNGVRPHHAFKGARIEDMAATILGVFGIGAPADTDGVALSEAFDDGFLNAGISAGQQTRAKQKADVYDRQDVEAIQKKLKELGYID